MATSSKKVNPKGREAEYPEDFRALGQTLMCIHCNHEVDCIKSSSLKDHLKSDKHIKCKFEAGSGNIKKPITIEQTISTHEKKQEFILDFVEMMAVCNIPFEKRDKMDSWLKKYVPNAGWIPSADTLRRDYLSKVLKKHKTEIVRKIKDQPISLMLDASPDRLSRNVVNTIISCGFTGERLLVDTRFGFR